MQIYTVQPGDSLYSISAAYQLSADTIAYVNQLIPPYELAVGQSLLLTEESPAAAQYFLSTAGYAYPFISPWVLEQSLPYLQELPVFSYGFTGNGELLPPALDDSWMITVAVSAGVTPILTLTPFGPDGNFNNALIHSMVQSETAKNNLISQLLQIVPEKGFGGVNVDFEYILKEDRDAFTAFVSELTAAMNRQGGQVSVALAPKVSATQTGVLFDGKDFQALGAAANHALLMTYEWGYRYGPPMAVAPLDQVRRVVTYATGVIPPGKLSLGLANYGYDWPLPYQKGITSAVTIGNVEAVQIAVQNGVPIEYDPVARSPYFYYTKDGTEHVVWFEDVRSWSEKLALTRDSGMEGVGIWQIMRLFRAGLILINSSYGETGTGTAG